MAAIVGSFVIDSLVGEWEGRVHTDMEHVRVGDDVVSFTEALDIVVAALGVSRLVAHSTATQRYWVYDGEVQQPWNRAVGDVFPDVLGGGYVREINLNQYLEWVAAVAQRE